jgi:hypothetical protein
MKHMGFGLVVVMAVAMLPQGYWADPIGTVDVPQILDAETFDGTSPQRTFRTTDGNITFNATYYDNDAACSGVQPTFAQIFVFNLEGLFINQFTAGAAGTASGPKYKILNFGIDASFFGAGSFRFTFLVRDCTNTKSVVLPEFVTFRVVAP